jgi:hypothetical protein
MMIDIWSSWNYDANIVSYLGFPVAHCRRALATIRGRLGDEQRGSNERSGTGISEVEVVGRAHRHGLMCGAGGRRWRRASLRMGMAAGAEGE